MARRCYLSSRYFERRTNVISSSLCWEWKRLKRQHFMCQHRFQGLLSFPGRMVPESAPHSPLWYLLIPFNPFLFSSPAADWQIGGLSVIRPWWPSRTSRSSSSLVMAGSPLGAFFCLPFKTKSHAVDLSRSSKVGDEAEPEALELSDTQIRTAVLCKSKGVNFTFDL